MTNAPELPTPASWDADDAIRRILRAMREHLRLDVAFVSEFTDAMRVFRHVDDAPECAVVVVGASDPVEESYCHYVVNGDIPEFVRDASLDPVASALPVTRELPVGTHLSVPIRFSDGSLYGTFCCFSRSVVDTVHEADLSGVRMMASVVGGYLEEAEAARQDVEARRERLRAVAPGTDLVMVFQPIVCLDERRVTGVEALARFPTSGRRPDHVFGEAWSLGIGEELELKAVRAALEQLPLLPEDTYLSVNVSPATLVCEEFLAAVRSQPAHRVVVEVTEHAAVEDYDQLVASASALMALGVRLAIDDVGTGFSGLNHILRLEPDILKIDAALVRDVDHAPAKQAMISALVAFATRMRTTLVAEGIETLGELNTLTALGVGCGQGYLLSRPAPLPVAFGTTMDLRARSQHLDRALDSSRAS